MAVAAATPHAGTYSGPWRAEADAAADRNDVPRQLFRSLVNAESGWNPNARSPAGAIGLAQLMPDTAHELRVDPRKPAENLDGGARYLRAQFDRFGDWELALAAYNAGPGAVAKYGGIPPFAETRRYVAKVMAAAGDIAELAAAKFTDWIDPAGANVDKVNADLLARLFLLGAYLEKKITVRSGYRSTAEQARLYDEFVEGKRAGPVAPPGSSKHEKGDAIDAEIDGVAIGKAVDAETLGLFGLKSLASIHDAPHVEKADSDPFNGAEVDAGAVGPGAALLAAGALLRVAGPKLAGKLKGLLGKIKGGAKSTGKSLAKYGALGGLLAALDITGAIDLKRGALWLLFTLGGLALVLIGVLRLVGLKAGTVVNVARGKGIE